MEWINSYWQIEEDISTIEWDIKKSKLELMRWEEGGDLFESNTFAAALDHQERIRKSIVVLEDLLRNKQKLKDELLELMDNFKGLDKQILKLKYIDQMTLENIAEKLNFSFSYIAKKHAEIVRTYKLAEKISKK